MVLLKDPPPPEAACRHLKKRRGAGKPAMGSGGRFFRAVPSTSGEGHPFRAGSEEKGETSMAPRVINVTLLNSTTVDTLQSHNPLEVVPDDTVRWRFMDSAGVDIQDALIEFRGFLPAVSIPPPAIEV
jgi:hypothetical protein